MLKNGRVALEPKAFRPSVAVNGSVSRRSLGEDDVGAPATSLAPAEAVVDERPGSWAVRVLRSSSPDISTRSSCPTGLVVQVQQEWEGQYAQLPAQLDRTSPEES